MGEISLTTLKGDSIKMQTEFVQSISKTEWDLVDPQIHPREVISPENFRIVSGSEPHRSVNPAWSDVLSSKSGIMAELP
jgi:hypothetical protein